MRLVTADSLGGSARQPVRPRGFRADCGETAPAGEREFLLGVGRHADVRTASLRLAGARLVRALERMGIPAIRLEGLSDIASGDDGSAGAAQAIAEGMAIGQWRFDLFEGTANTRPPRGKALSIDAGDAAGRRGLKTGLLLGNAVNEARRIAATPPNVSTPAWIAAEARRLARRHGLSCRVISARQAAAMGMGGLTSVGQGSTAPPCLVLLEHRPRSVSKAARGQRLALVGKTITYDTGGYSLKANNGMRGMKYDKCGGAAVLGAMVAIAESKVPMEVVALLPAAENMVAGDSYRPDDIITMHNGVTVEVTNTDAEGRLVLGDALSYACRTIKPTAIVDIATLTGGVVVALGAFSAGYFCNDAALQRRVEDASARTAEKVWRLPLWPEHRDFMRSQHADILNSNPKREAHPVQGAAFLSYFVDPSIPWAHLDIAGVNAIESANDAMVAGPTGWGVRLLHELASDMAK